MDAAVQLPLTAAERAELLRLARRAIAAHLGGGERLPAPAEPPVLAWPRGVFVSLHEHGELRGCIGQPYARLPLAEAVIECAIAAAVDDPRFPPVGAAELAAIAIELSVLTAPATCAPDDVVVGRDGVMIERDRRRGLLLPQVATRHGWSRERFLSETCRKAGLPPSAWRDPGTRIERFGAEVFAEPAPAR